MIARAVMMIALLAMPWALSAHEGGGPEPEAEALAADRNETSAAARPHLLADGQLYLPKAMQRALGLRTEVFTANQGTAQVELMGEVIAAPDATGHITAGQAGRLEAPSRNWALPGAKIAAGETLAYLRPLLSAREQAQRRAVLAQVDEDLQISEINVERLKLQAQANGSFENSGNIYYEQAQLERQGLQEKYRLESAALNDRVAIRAPVGGLLNSVYVRAGDVVAEGQPLFEIVDAEHLRIALNSFDPDLAQRVRSARLRADGPGATTTALTLHGLEPLGDRQGWRLLFDVQPTTKRTLMPGQLASIALQLSAAATPRAFSAACVAGTTGTAAIWVHVAPERFEKRSVPACQFSASGAGQTASIAPGERVVTQAAALLSEYR